ncbi:MAG: SDR family NAD(P)-dependent oxidoreductase [Halioglobus sp.]|nr:SDR family NAD(P)-dependent oxidoreductase [Halioglobus sp.]
MNPVGSFTITADTSQSFARLSGDHNPLHLDAVAARRTQFGRTLIHGVCGTAQAIDLWLASNPGHAALKKMKVRYAKPITQGEEITLLAEHQADKIRLELHANGTRCQMIDLEFAGEDAGPMLQPEFSPAVDNPPPCQEPDIATCQGHCAAADLVWDAALAEQLFPHAAAKLPPRQLASLLATTQIVGMQCPGLHSVYSNLELEFIEAGDAASTSQLHYSVGTADARFNRVVMGVCNAYVQGTIEAFFRAVPAEQASMSEVTKAVPANTFTGQKALLVGASRGLGEVMAKVLAAGGAEVVLTYARGHDDAEQVAADIATERAQPAILQHNVLSGDIGGDLEQSLTDITHVYYLASPIIEKGETGRWNGELFARFCHFYIDGLAALLEHTRKVVGKERAMHLFIPSSVFLDGGIKGFDEYIAAKHAAEAYAERFVSAHKNWSVNAPRLPRLRTDQTSGVDDSGPDETLSVIAALLQETYPAA